MLNFTQYPGPTDRPTLMIVHGLYGSARNWGVIAKRLSDKRPVIAVDQRNHGLSPWADSHSYLDMAGDLAEVIDLIEGDGDGVDVLGHSMGGKAAMTLALTQPALVNRLIVADIAPVAYAHTQLGNLEAMRAVDLSQVTRRSEAEAQLARHIDDPALRSFFTQSLDIKEQRWRLNLEVLAAEMDKILGFPDLDGSFSKDTLFLSGALSNYVRREDRGQIVAKFPKARFVRISGAGHWLHAEKPREFTAALEAWLG